MSTAIQEKSTTVSTIGLHLDGHFHKTHKGPPLTAEECIAQVSRLIASPIFLGSEALCKLLKYLSHHTLHTPADHLKEYTIATEVFGRPSDFNPQVDSYVRVQMGRLRTKLTQYYETEGILDTILVDVPKGRYLLSFEHRDLPAEVDPPVEAPTDHHPAETASAEIPRSRRLLFVLSGAALLLVISAAVWAVAHATHPGTPAATATPANPLTTLWSPFLTSSAEPIVVFATADFVGEAETGMRYYEPSRDQHSRITQHYTGVGEVLGVLELDRLFQRSNRRFHVKRGSLFTLDDARANNLIFVGSPTENLTLKEIPGTQEFQFRRIPAQPNQHQEVIVNTHPHAGESSIYAFTDGKPNEGYDYAVIALRRGLDSAQWTLILAGTSTIGTEGAVDFACDPHQVETLLKRMNISRPSELKPFEALLKVTVANDVPLSVQMLALHLTGR